MVKLSELKTFGNRLRKTCWHLQIRTVSEAKRKAEKEKFGDVLSRENDKAEICKIAKQITATSRDVAGDKCVKNNRGVLATSDQEKHLA